MKNISNILFALLFVNLYSCSEKKYDQKGFSVESASENTQEGEPSGLNQDSIKFETKPTAVLLTGLPHIRLTAIYKVNYSKDKTESFIGSNNFYYSYYEDQDQGNNWHDNFIPGLEAVYGYNMVNISHYNIKENKQKYLFKSPVLIRNFYYPTFSKDSLNFKPVKREYFIVSAYNEDTNKDGYINLKDLRRLYLFNINGDQQKILVPEDYSVYESQYDSGNDYMFVFAKKDSNKNGVIEKQEPIHIFWIDLNDPNKTGQKY